MLGVENSYVHDDDITISLSLKCKIYLRFFKLLYSTPKEMKKLNLYFEQNIELYRNKVAKANTAEEYMEIYQTILQDIASRWGITLVNDIYTFIYMAMVSEEQSVRLGNVKGIESMKPIQALKELQELRLASGEKCYEFQMLFEDYIQKYGDRSLEELKLESKTFATNPEMLLEYIRNQNFNDFCSKDDKLDYVRRESFAQKRAKRGMYHREISRMNRSRAIGLAREILLHIGEIFCGEGVIENKQDIFYLYIEEIESIIKEKKNLKIEIEQRIKLYETYEELPSFNRIVFADKIIQKTYQNIGGCTSLKGENRLQGIPCSQGIVEGEVLVLTRADLGINTKEKILITKSTDPGWVFLIQNSAGIISEKGSLLSHTAIVSRELKKPSIVGVDGATSFFKDGERLRIDGTTGKIERLDIM